MVHHQEYIMPVPCALPDGFNFCYYTHGPSGEAVKQVVMPNAQAMHMRPQPVFITAPGVSFGVVHGQPQQYNQQQSMAYLTMAMNTEMPVQRDVANLQQVIPMPPVVAEEDELEGFLNDVFDEDVFLKQEAAMAQPTSSLVIDHDATLAHGIKSPGSNATDCCGSSSTSDESDMATRKIYYRRSWTPEQDYKLIKLVEQHGAKNWSKIALSIPGKTGNQCSQRWHKALDPSLKKGKWSPDEDDSLRSAVKKLGCKWKQISKLIPGRTGKQCRDRYTARLDPKLTGGKWTPEEEEMALNAYKKYGNKWATIAKVLPHRSWYTIKWKIETLVKEEERQQ